MTHTYSVEMNRTGSTTASVGTVTADGSAPRRGHLLYACFGSEATPADNAFLWQIARVTAAGTSTAVTPQALDPASPAAINDAGENHTVEPTYTANAILLSVALNQKATFQWYGAPGRYLIFPGTAANGLGVKTPTASAVAITATLHVTE